MFVTPVLPHCVFVILFKVIYIILRDVVRSSLLIGFFFYLLSAKTEMTFVENSEINERDYLSSQLGLIS